MAFIKGLRRLFRRWQDPNPYTVIRDQDSLDQNSPNLDDSGQDQSDQSDRHQNQPRPEFSDQAGPYLEPKREPSQRHSPLASLPLTPVDRTTDVITSSNPFDPFVFDSARGSSSRPTCGVPANPKQKSSTTPSENNKVAASAERLTKEHHSEELAKQQTDVKATTGFDHQGRTPTNFYALHLAESEESVESYEAAEDQEFALHLAARGGLYRHVRWSRKIEIEIEKAAQQLEQSAFFYFEGAADTTHTNPADTQQTVNSDYQITASPSEDIAHGHPGPSYPYPDTRYGHSDSADPLPYAYRGHPDPTCSRPDFIDHNPLSRRRALTNLQHGEQLGSGNNHLYPVFQHPVVSDSNLPDQQGPAFSHHRSLRPSSQDPNIGPIMESSQSNRRLTSDLLAVPPVMGNDRIVCIEDARIQQELIRKNFETDGKGSPPFELVEMIGKGSYGRVYKAKYLEPPHNAHEFVAIKVVNADAQDYRMMAEERDHSFNDFKNELHILKVLSETKAKNINKVFDAFVLHSQLVWITEYCPGGSIRTIMNAQPGRCLAEKYVIAAAREIAIGLKCLHDAGIIHRDVKAANVLIHEDGRLQLCDFGTSSMLIGEMDKRSTILGTPHWMPLEMHEAGGKKQVQYRTEVDVWAYGCTIWELVTGTPPNAGKGLNRQLEISLRRGAPRLTGDEYSTEVKEFLEFVLQTDPNLRPSMQQILNHPFLKDTETTHPCSLLSELVAAVIRFRHEGGQRQSLLHPGGALPPGIDSDLYDREFRESWNFSSTESFFTRHSRIIDLKDLASLAETDETSPPAASGIKELTPIEKINFDERVRRGAEAMGGLFNESKPEYKYVAKRDFREIKETKRISDLPLRDATERSTVRDTQIDLGDFDPSHYVGEPANFPVIQLADADTIRANRSNSRLFRDASEEQLTAKPGDLEEFAVSSSGDESKRPATQEWKFPSFMQPETESNEEDAVVPKRATLAWTFPKEALDEEEPTMATRPTLKHAATEPTVLPANAVMLGSMFSSSPPPGDSSFDDSIEMEPEIPRPSTASSMSSDADYDPFKFDLDVNALAGSPNLQETQQAFDGEIQQMLAESGYDTYRYSRIAPAPMIAERPLLSERNEALFREYANMAAPVSQTLETPSLGSAGFPAQNISIVGGLGASVVGAAVVPAGSAAGRRSNIWVDFPEIVAPSSEAMMEGASEQVMADELDRLLGDWVVGLEAVGKAFGELPEEMAWADGEEREREEVE